MILTFAWPLTVHVPVMDRLREMNVRTLLNTRIDLNSLKTPPSSPYSCGTPTTESASTPYLSPTCSTPDLSESPCSTPPTASPHLPSFILPPPVVQQDDSCATIRTTDGREINADLIVGPHGSSSILGPYILCSSFVPARPTTPRSWRCYHQIQSTTRMGRRRMSCPPSNLGLRRIVERSGSPNIHTYLSSGTRPMLLGP